MVAQPAGMNGVRDKVTAQGVHLEDRHQAGAIAEVKTIHTARERGGRSRFNSQEARLPAFAQVAAQEGEGDAASWSRRPRSQ